MCRGPFCVPGDRRYDTYALTGGYRVADLKVAFDGFEARQHSAGMTQRDDGPVHHNAYEVNDRSRWRTNKIARGRRYVDSAVAGRIARSGRSI